MKQAAKLSTIAIAVLCAGASFSIFLSDVAPSAEKTKPLKAGADMPNPSFGTLDGKKSDLKSLVGGKPTVLIFYRGGWCPFCNRHLAELGKIEGKLKDLGYQIVAASMDTPTELKKTMTKEELSYRLVSDSTAEGSKAFGIAFKVEDSLVDKYKNEYKIDIEAASGQKHHILPVPSVFILSKSKVAYSYANPDYRVRLSSDELLAAAKSAL